jgi:Ca2+-binding RTX toxin-like protein
VLIGGVGDDLLVADQGADLLIGGDGQDVLDGGKGDDILVAGFTSFDDNLVALDAMLAEWQSSRSYTARALNLRNGTGGTIRFNDAYYLSASSVFDDSKRDTLIGDHGRDWFFADRDGLDADDDLLMDRNSDEWLELLDS